IFSFFSNSFHPAASLVLISVCLASVRMMDGYVAATSSTALSMAFLLRPSSLKRERQGRTKTRKQSTAD
ncbi:MAG TPA: hypothetical protein PK156_36175, partial [Polyangium sp.]|nr:hypothetical protein [Polyangium sp.]